MGITTPDHRPARIMDLNDIHTPVLLDRCVELLGPALQRDGAVLVDAAGATHAVATVERPRSTVGAGDCLLAGCLDALGRGLPAADVISAGVRWGSAAVALPGSAVPTPDDLARVHAVLTPDPDLTRTLS